MDAELAGRAEDGERLDLYLIGRAALILRYGLDVGTRDVDVVHFHGSRLELAAVEAFGRGTSNAERFGFYLEPVPQGLPPIPGRWRVLRPMQPDPHDLAVTKLKRFHAKDREDLQILSDSGGLDVDLPWQGLESAFAWAEKDGPDREAAARNLAWVVIYLEGRTPSL